MAVTDLETVDPALRNAFAGAALLPGMPQLLAAEQPPAWAQLADAARATGEDLRAERPDTLVVLSTQWFTVLGHQVQMDSRCTGRRVDENWYAYEYGTQDYDFAVDVELSERWAQEIEANGFQARRTRYEGFPIDGGVIVAGPLLDPEGSLPIAQVSCNLYAAAQDLGAIAAAALRAAASLDRRVAFVAISGLSSALTQRWIEPGDDRVEAADNERWDRRMLDLLAGDRLAEALAACDEYARAAQADSRFRALSFLAGTGCLEGPADVRAYGPLWGTGGAVVHWPSANTRCTIT